MSLLVLHAAKELIQHLAEDSLLGFGDGGDSVIDDCNFIASTGPKMSTALEPALVVRICAHSTSRGPRTGCARYALASACPEIAYSLEMLLRPRPAIWGNTNHIQWLTFRPARSSCTTRAWVPPASWASTKR